MSRPVGSKNKSTIAREMAEGIAAIPNPNAGEAAAPAERRIKVSGSYVTLGAEGSKELTETTEITFSPAANSADAIARLGSDDAELTKAINQYLLKRMKRAARKEIESKGVDSASLMTFIRPLRMVYFTDLLVKGADGEVTSESRKKQTDALINFVASNPAFLEAVHKLSDAARAAADSDDDEAEAGE